MNGFFGQWFGATAGQWWGYGQAVAPPAITESPGSFYGVRHHDQGRRRRVPARHDAARRRHLKDEEEVLLLTL